MELICEKYREAMAAEGARCRHPTEYCKFRAGCLIHFRAARNREAAGPAKEESLVTTLRFDKGGGLLPAIAQDYESGEVLMLAYVNEEAWQRTLATGKAHYWSRSRDRIWLKGESSGHVQLVKEIRIDCDGDTVLYRVEQLGGAACHTGHRSCFHRLVRGGEVTVVGERLFDPAEVYKK